MIQIYAYQILSDRADSKLYYEASHRDKTLQFIKICSNQWDMYFKGVHVATISPGFISLSYETVDETYLRAAFETLRQIIMDIVSTDESYQFVDFQSMITP